MPDNPTPVNISDLPVALSANGVNLIGDHNGTTKQVPVNLLVDEITPADIGAVPSTRTVNNKALSSDITLDKTDIGLGNVDNTSDANKPVSAAQQAAIDGRVPITRTINGKALSADLVLDAVGSITLSLSWSGSGPYTQVVTVTGATVTANSKVDLQLTPAQIAQLISDGVEALVIENNAGTLTATAIGATPSVALTVQCTVTEVST